MQPTVVTSDIIIHGGVTLPVGLNPVKQTEGEWDTCNESNTQGWV